MNQWLNDGSTLRILRKGIVSYYKQHWEMLAKSLRGFEPHPYEYYLILLAQVRALAPIMFYAYDFFPLRIVYANISKLYEEVIEKVKKHNDD